MKILLINPPANILESRSEIKFAAQPLGLAYVAAVLEENGYEVNIFDTLIGEGFTNEAVERPGYIRYGLSCEDIRKKIERFQPDLVGVSGLHSNRVYEIAEVLDAVKEVSKEIISVVGGGYASIHSEHCLSNRNCDYIIIGEGEYSFLELVRKLEEKRDVSGIDGLGYKNSGKLQINPKTKLINDIDRLPMPAYHLLSMSEYYKIQMPGSRYKRRNYTLFCGSRGCPYRCSYCAKDLIVGRGYRKRSIPGMIEEIRYLKRDFAVEEIRFVDYHTMADIKHWTEFCNALIKQRVDITFNDPHGFSVNLLDDELLVLMRRAGCNHLYISVESGSRSFLEHLSKPVELSRVDGIVAKAHRLGLPVTAYFIIGLPGQRWGEVMHTVNYAKTLDIDDVDFFIANPFPGTGIETECKDAQLIDEEIPPGTF